MVVKYMNNKAQACSLNPRNMTKINLANLRVVGRILEVSDGAGLKLVVVVLLFFYVHATHLWSCRDGQLV